MQSTNFVDTLQSRGKERGESTACEDVPKLEEPHKDKLTLALRFHPEFIDRLIAYTQHLIRVSSRFYASRAALTTQCQKSTVVISSHALF